MLLHLFIIATCVFLLIKICYYWVISNPIKKQMRKEQTEQLINNALREKEEI